MNLPDKYLYLSLNKIPLGLLSKDGQTDLKEAYDEGYQISMYTEASGWINIPVPGWCSTVVYRVVEKPVVKPEVPWEFVADQWKYYAIDRDGTAWFFEKVPEYCNSHGYWGGSGWGTTSAKILKINQNGCKPEDSLVKRPEEV